MSRRSPLLWIITAGVMLGLGFFLYRLIRPITGRSVNVRLWLQDPAAHADWSVHARSRCSPGAPFLIPTDGFIGYLWDDSFQIGKRHQGIDILGGTAPGKTPVVAAYSGFLTRLPAWKSSVIIRIPSDPLQPARQIWLYYTHLADETGNSFISSSFPPGTTEKPIEVGTLIGFQGNYNGEASNPTSVHLHFSIVQDDGDGNFRNELDITNTLDPSPYLGLPLNARATSLDVIVCPQINP